MTRMHMRSVFARILGQHAADILSQMTNSKPGVIEVGRLIPQGTSYELAAGIDFTGALAEEGSAQGGRLICGAVKKADIEPLLAAVVQRLGLNRDILDTPNGPQDLLNEFLNIIIGLTGADWAVHGYDMDFSPPRVLNSLSLPTPESGDQAFYIKVFTEAGPQVDIAVVFCDREAPFI